MEMRSMVCGDNVGVDVVDYDFSDFRGWKCCF